MVIVALVTGGSSGLGLATVKQFLKSGKKVVIFDLLTSDGSKVANELGDNVLFVACDVSCEEDVSGGLAKIKEVFGRLDICVNCAGILLRTAISSESDIMSIYKRIFEVNVFGTVNVIRFATSLMSENAPDEEGQRGIIINTASISGTDGHGFYSAYSSSKAAVAGLTLPLAREFGSLGIRVMAISPGIIETPMTKDFDEEHIQKYSNAIPFPKRRGKPEEFALLCEAIVENRYLNAEVIRLDGGSRNQK